jgi:hypothetical protein
VLGYRTEAIHSGKTIQERADIIKRFTKQGGTQVLVLSYLTGNEGLNLHESCYTCIMLEQGANHASEHQAWCRIRRIGQTQVQKTYRLVNMDTVDRAIELAQRNKQTPMLYAFGFITDHQNFVAGQLYDTMIGSKHPLALRDLEIDADDDGEEDEVEEVEEQRPDQAYVSPFSLEGRASRADFRPFEQDPSASHAGFGNDDDADVS